MKSHSTSPTAVCQVSRRKLLLGGFAFGCMAAFTPRAEQHTKTLRNYGFPHPFGISDRQKNLSPVLARRYYSALYDQFSDLPARIANLSKEIQASGIQTMDDYLSHGPTPDARDTAKMIVSAWYLGVTGPDLKNLNRLFRCVDVPSRRRCTCCSVLWGWPPRMG